MKRPTLVIAALLLAACGQAAVRPDTRSVDWLAGCWQADSGDSTYQEMWLPPAPDGMLGAAREIRAGRTVSYEFIRIELRSGGSVVYVAQPKGQATVEFRLVEHDQGRLAFENPAHDFPTRIEYRYVDFNALHARLSGTVAGRAQASDYPMQRVACE